LIELLVVIAIIAVLIGLLLAAVQKGRQAAALAKTLNHLKQVALGSQTYHDTNGCFPSALGPIPADTPNNVYAFLTQLLPFVEQGTIQNQVNTIFNDGSSWASRVVPVYLSPLDSTSIGGLGQYGNGASNIAVNFQIVGNPAGTTWITAMLNVNPRLAASFPDGTSNTIFFATKYAICGQGGSEWANCVIYPWNPNSSEPATDGAYFGGALPNAVGVGSTFQLQPASTACNPDYAQAFTQSGLPVALVDGSCRMVSPTISALTWRYALLPNDGQVLGSDW